MSSHPDRLLQLDSPHEEGFDRLARLAARLLDAPVSLISVIDHHNSRHFFKSAFGLQDPWAGSRQAPLSHSLCRLVEASGKPLSVPDTGAEDRFRDSPAVTEFGIAAYLGVPIHGMDARAIGALCVIDRAPHRWTDEDADMLADIAAAVTDQIRLTASSQALTESLTTASRFGRIVETAEHEVFLFDAGTLKFTEVNRGARTNLGYSLEELRGLTPLNIKPEYSIDRFNRLIAPLLDHSTPAVSFETVHRRKDGTDYPVAIRLELHGDDRGEMFVAFCKDITVERELTREARETEGRLSAILNAAQGGIVGLSPEGLVRAANPSAREILGLTDSALPFDWPADLEFLEPGGLGPLPPDRDPIRRTLAGDTLQGETFLIRRSVAAMPRYVRLSSAPIPDAAGGDVRAVVLFDDVTDQEHNRQQLERAGRLEALGQLTGGVAHDINNLLATIEYAVQLAAQTAPETATRYLDTARDTVRRGAALTNRLLAFAKRQPGLAKSSPVAEAMAEFERLARPAIEEALHIDFDPASSEDEALWVFCDLAQLENALLNLVLNSRDAILDSQTGDRIVVAARAVADVARIDLPPQSRDIFIADALREEASADGWRDDGKVFRYIEFSVTDNGPGMSAEVKRRAVDPFFTTKGNNAGTGLGLSMVYGFVRQSGGELRVYSEPGQGTTVRMLLPRGTPGGDRESPVDREPAAAGAGQRILVVEDDIGLLRITAEMIGALGYSVFSARSGDEAVALIDAGEPADLLLSDVVLPGGMGGFVLAQEIRARRPGLPVVYMSGYTGIAASEMGPVNAPLIQKPCPPGELARTLQTALNGGT